MAKALNKLTQGISGMIGKTLVFRRVGNDTIVSAAPAKPKQWSGRQQTLRNRFKQAATYARAQTEQPLMKAAYALSVKDKPTRTAYHAALADFLNPPEMMLQELNNNSISVLAEDDFRVTRVRIQVFSVEGLLQQSAEAMQQPNGLEWVYVFGQHDLQKGCSIKATAYDVPGNETSMVVEV
jgi:hypothetical protein